ncbi:MAG: gliding motility-associated protein GldE [Porphyromonadaceae bacterium]|nr:gliding motility-associated protein GldE [Porphyromonadaceae bacterium]
MMGRGVIFLVLTLLGLAGAIFTALSETAFSSLSFREREVAQQGRTSADSHITSLLSQVSPLAVTLLGVNRLANLVTVLSGLFLLSTFFDFSRMVWWGVLSLFLLFVIVIILFGEILPQISAHRHALKTARLVASPLLRMVRLFRGISKGLLSIPSVNDYFAQKARIFSMNEWEMPQSDTEEEKEMLQGIVRFRNKTAQEIMTARTDMTDIDIHLHFKEMLQVVFRTGYSRIPVYEDSQDNIRGIIYIKDLLPYISQEEDFNWRRLIRPAYFVLETKMIDELLADFQRKKVHMAVLVDEFGGTSGIVTLEDILEEIVGEISDEYDEDLPLYTRIDDTHYLFQAKIPLEDFYEVVQATPGEFSLDGDVETLAGLILSVMDDFPKLYERIRIGRFLFQVVEIEKYRIEKIKVTIEPNGKGVANKS